LPAQFPISFSFPEPNSFTKSIPCQGKVRSLTTATSHPICFVAYRRSHSLPNTGAIVSLYTLFAAAPGQTTLR
jgi:hypothetical protein